jgi:hypothetical protein
MHDANITDGNAFPNEVEIDLDMLHTLVLNGVGGEVDDADVVIVDENVVGDIDVEVREGVGEALHLPIVVVDAEVALNEAPKGGIDVEGAGFAVAEEVVLQFQPGVVSRVTAMPGYVLQVRGDSVPDPRLDDVVHPVPSWNTDVRGVQEHVIRERVMLEGERDVVVPPGVVQGGEVQCDRDERTDVLHAGGLDAEVGDDGSLVVIVRRSSTTDRGRGWRRRRRLDQGRRAAGFLGEGGSRTLLLLL